MSTPRQAGAPVPRRSLTTVGCASCGTELDDRAPHAVCPSCGGLLAVEHAPPDVRGPALRARFDTRLAARAPRPAATSASGVWRFAELVLPDAGAEIVSHPEGNTPLLEREAISRFTGVATLRLKHEGYNPTGSFKDRGMTVAMTQACRAGAAAVACASTGNTSASLAAYAAQAGLPALVLVPARQVAAGKLAQTLFYGATVLAVRGDFDACLRLVRDASSRLGVYLVNSVNPFRLEGQKTIVFDLLQQLGWEPPDWIALPAGNLGNTSAFGAALRQALALGLIDRVPRLLAVQASGAAPFAQAFRDGLARRVTVRAETVATAIRIGDPASWERAVDAVRFTRGVVTAVSDDEILEAKHAVDTAGVGCEPASAASVAGVRALVRQGTIARDDRVVAVLTGHVLKDPSIETTRGPVEVEPELGAVEAVLRGLARGGRA